MDATRDGYRLLLEGMERVGPLIREALAREVVLATWGSGEQEAVMTAAAGAQLAAAVAGWSRAVTAARVVFPGAVLGGDDVPAMLRDLLTGTARQRLARHHAPRQVEPGHIREALDRVGGFVAEHGWTALARYYLVISLHEDLNALAYYGRMSEAAFLWGTLHRPWSALNLGPQLRRYRQAGLVRRVADAPAPALELTSRGHVVLERLRAVLDAAGETAWRANLQREVLLVDGTDYDRALYRVFPESDAFLEAFCRQLPLPAGAQVLEVAAGAGRLTFDAGLAGRVAAAGGRLVAVESLAPLRERLEAKRRIRGAAGLDVVAGEAERLPFPDGSFDLVVSAAPHAFADLGRAVGEMVRVSRSGGSVHLANPQGDAGAVPLVAVWFRPLARLAERAGSPGAERPGLPPGRLAEALRQAGLRAVRVRTVPGRVRAADAAAFLTVALRSGHLTRSLLARMPVQERQDLLRRLVAEGRRLAAVTPAAEQEAAVVREMVCGRRP
ncbi:putative Methyltransferase type 11 [Candidatus Hydrogenisulfobacillus filiaventi]|uniref:Putative Methyltransferase type 11 n=1 Tax=Candidatus Hydrogenisulfobacillus filiaventi TaxID=2707344 RepID=A0A6F8ZES1_9FIRM|nr:methyltransferase domain-containing protein [Bacillota bacterium]CAB1128368.1 putative Methyltransferase type 11 [Candidatus Hydrogenisulfobacillus filiaventi]